MNERKEYNLNIFTRIGLLLFVVSPYFIWAETSVAFRDIIIIFALIIFGGVISKTIKVKAYHIFSLLFWVEALLSTIIAGQELSTTVIVFALFVMMYILVTGIDIAPLFIVRLLDTFILGSIIVSLFVIISAAMGRTYMGTHFYARYSLDSIGIIKNPNYLTAFFVGAYVILLFGVMFKSSGSIAKTFIRIALLLEIAIACILTGTRASLLTISVVSVLTLLGFVFKKSSAKRRVINSFLLVVFILLLYYIIIRYVPATVFNRLDLADSYRQSAWNIAFHDFLSGNIITGFGINGVVDSISVIGRDLHSMLLQVLFDQGILGFLFFLGMVLNGHRKLGANNLFFVIILEIAMYFSFIFNNGCSTVTFWFPIILIRLVMNCCEKLKDISSLNDYWQANSVF